MSVVLFLTVVPFAQADKVGQDEVAIGEWQYGFITDYTGVQVQATADSEGDGGGKQDMAPEEIAHGGRYGGMDGAVAAG